MYVCMYVPCHLPTLSKGYLPSTVSLLARAEHSPVERGHEYTSPLLSSL